MKSVKVFNGCARPCRRQHLRCRKFLKLRGLGRWLKRSSPTALPVEPVLCAIGTGADGQWRAPTRTPEAQAAAHTFEAIAAARRATSSCRSAEVAELIASALMAVARLQKLVDGEVGKIWDNLKAAHTEAARLKKGGSADNVAVKLKVLISLDVAYHRLLYTVVLIGDAMKSVVPLPHCYFSERGGAWDAVPCANLANGCRDFFRCFGIEEQTGIDVARSFLDSESGGVALDNPLLSLLQSRWCESVVLLADVGVVPSTPDKCSPPPAPPPGQSLTMRGRNPVCGQLVREWRDSARVWACHIYSYAVPNEQAIVVLKQQAPLVEVGAGTGYWASLLRARGAEVFAYDVDPPQVSGGTAGADCMNEYHGKCTAWTHVARGGPEAVSRHGQGVSLFLCYPPPDSAMALKTLCMYQGNVVCHVGEWRGDTGTPAFHSELVRTFDLEQQVSLPNWGDSSAELTVWRRRTTSASTGGECRSPLACWGCGKRGDGNLQRCRLSYDAVFCSKRCATHPGAAARHRAVLAMRFALLSPGGAPQHPLPFGDSRYFKCAAA